MVASPAHATGSTPMDGTRVGADARGQTAQVTLVGNKVIAVYWIDDYHDPAKLRASDGGARLEFDIAGGHAVFTRAARRGRMTVRYPDGRTVTIEMKKD